MLRFSPSIFHVRAVNDEESDSKEEPCDASMEAPTKLVELSDPCSLTGRRKKVSDQCRFHQ